MLQIVLFSALVATCLGQVEHCCSADDRAVVQEQWNSIWNTPDSARVKIAIGRALFDNFLAQEPEATSLFERVNVANPDSGEYAAHMLRVLGGVDILIALLRDSQALQSEVSHLAAQHAVREGVTAVRFQAFLNVMLETLPGVLSDFNGDAWRSCFSRFFEAIVPGN